MFCRDNTATNYLCDWFDVRGKVVGTRRELKYVFRGREIDSDTFHIKYEEVLKVFSR